MTILNHAWGYTSARFSASSSFTSAVADHRRSSGVKQKFTSQVPLLGYFRAVWIEIISSQETWPKVKDTNETVSAGRQIN